MNLIEHKLRDALGVHEIYPKHKSAFSPWDEISQSKAKPNQIHVMQRRSGPQHQLIQTHHNVCTALPAPTDPERDAYFDF